MTEEEWSLTPERMKKIRVEASTGLGLDNGFASTVILSAFDLIEELREQIDRRCSFGCGELVAHPEDVYCRDCL